MSKKKNKKNSNRKNYKIESLEPRLLMDATQGSVPEGSAQAWLNETSEYESISTYKYSTKTDLTIDGVLLQKGSEDGISSKSISIDELISKDELDYSDDVDKVKSFISTEIENLKNEFVENAKKDKVASEKAYSIAKAVYKENPSEENKSALKKAENAWLDANDRFKNPEKRFVIKADDLAEHLQNAKKEDGWKFETVTKVDGSKAVKITIQGDVTKIQNVKKEYTVVPDEENIGVGVTFEAIKGKDAVFTGEYSLSFEIDGIENNSLANSMSVSASLGFKQDLNSEKAAAKNGVLDLKSIEDADESQPDMIIKGTYSTDSSGKNEFKTEKELDLDFAVVKPEFFDSSFNVKNTAHVKYVTENGQKKWTSDGEDNDAFLSSFSNAQMGDILKQLNAVSCWLKNLENGALSNDFKGIIDQNASSFLNLSKAFEKVIKTPPRSLQELVAACKSSLLRATVSFKNTSNGLVCSVVFSSSIKSTENKVSIKDDLIKKVNDNLSIISKNSINLDLDSTLNLTLDIPLTVKDDVSADTKLNEIGIDAVEQKEAIGLVDVLVASDTLQPKNQLTENITLSLLKNGQSQSIELNENARSTSNQTIAKYVCASLGSEFKVVEDDSTGKYLLYTDSYDSVSIEFVNGESRQIGFAGTQRFCNALRLNEANSITVNGTEIKDHTSSKSQDGLVTAINDYFMQNSDFEDYAAIKMGTEIFIICSASEKPQKGYWENFSKDSCKECLVLLSSTLPVKTLTGSAKFQFTVEGNDLTLELFQDDFVGCYTVEDVASVINSKLKKLSNVQTVFAEVRSNEDGINCIAFRCSKSFSVVASGDFTSLGFSNLTASKSAKSTSNCLRLTFGTEQYDVSVKDVLTADTTIEDLLKSISTKCNKPVQDLTLENLTKVEDINGFILGTLLGLTTDNQDGYALKVRAEKQTQVSISTLSLSVVEKLYGKSITNANLNAVGLEIAGDFGIKSTQKISLKENYSLLESISHVAYSNDNKENSAKKLDDFFNVEQTKYECLSSADNLLSVSGVAGLSESGLNLGLISSEIDDKTKEISSSFSKLNSDVYDSVCNYSMESILESVSKVLKEEVLDKILAKTDDASKTTKSYLDALNSKLPLFGKSVPELLGLSAKVSDVISAISKNHPATLQELNALLQKNLGAKLNIDFKDSGIQFSFVWADSFTSRAVPIDNFSLDETLASVGGAAEVYMNGYILAQFDFLLEMKVGSGESPNASILNTSFVDFDASLVGNPLSFDLSVSVGNMTLPMMQVVKDSYAAVKITQKLVFEKDSKSGSISARLDSSKPGSCQIGGKLQLQCLGIDVGTVCLGVQKNNTLSCYGQDPDGGCFTLMDIANGKFGIVWPEELNTDGSRKNPNAGDIVLDLSQLKDFEKVDLFGKIKLVSDALSSVLRKAQSCLNKTFLSDSMRSIPLVGDSIVGAADCLTLLDEKFIEPFRKFAYNSQNLNAALVAQQLYSILNKSGLLQALTVEASTSQKVQWAGSSFESAYSKNGTQYVQYHEDAEKNEYQWRFCLGQTYALDGNADFDLGFPGLGLKSSGGVELELTWKWYLGFGINQNGAYIMLSNGNDIAAEDSCVDGIYKAGSLCGDDIQVALSVSPNVELDGSLGFLKMHANFLDGNNAKIFPDANGKNSSEKYTWTLGIDLNDGKSESSSLEYDKKEDAQNASTRISTNNISSGLSVEGNLEGDIDLKLQMTLGFGAGDTISIGFPQVGAIFELKWSAGFGNPMGSLDYVGFNSIYLDAGTFIQGTLQPILKKIQRVIDPVMPLIDFLQSEIPVLNKLPGKSQKITVLSLIQSVGKAKGLELGMIDDIIKVAKLIQTFAKEEADLGRVYLGKLDLLKSGSTNNTMSNFLAGKGNEYGTLCIDDSDAGIHLDGYTGKTSTTVKFNEYISRNAGNVNPGGIGWSFPIVTDTTSEVLKLLMGQHVSLVEYRMSPLKFGFDWSKSFAIVGPLFADIGFSFGVDIELAFGYDTQGLVSWKDSGFKDLTALLDGFYIDDLRDGQDVSEIIFYSGITAGASVGGRAGIDVGVNLNLNLNFDDPNNDGKVRLSELAHNLAKNPLTVFDASVTLQARAYAYLDLFFYRKEWDLWKSGALELFNTDKGDSDKPVLATEQDGDVVVNIGENAAKRIKGGLQDGDETVDVFINGKTCIVTYGGKQSTYTVKDTIENNVCKKAGALLIYAGEGNDNITITGTNVQCNVIVYGGDGNDKINLSEMTFADGYYAVLMGNSGVDTILGANGGTTFAFGEDGRVVLDDEKSRVLLAESYPSDNTASNNVIIGGKGKNFLFGGLGNDFITGGKTSPILVDGKKVGDRTDNYLFGDFGRVDLVNNQYVVSRENLFEEGGDDTILGGDIADHIYGGAGNDSIDGGAGNDTIHAGMGNDLVYGGSGSDSIWGDDGVDVIFGDKPTDEGLVIAQEGNGAGVLPYAYVSEELKNEKSQLFSENSTENGKKTIKLYGRSLAIQYKYKEEDKNLSAIALSKIAEFDNGLETTVKAAGDMIDGGNGSDIIFGDNGANGAGVDGGSDQIAGGAGNDFIDGDAGNDTITGDYGDDVIYGGQGADTIDGNSGNDIVFGDDGWNGYSAKGDSTLYDDGAAADAVKQAFGNNIEAFVTNFGIRADAKSSGNGGDDVITAGNGGDFIDGQDGNDTYKIALQGGSNHAFTNVMDSGVNDVSDSMTIDGTLEADNLLLRASSENLGFVALLPEGEKSQVERVNFWKSGDDDRGLENISLNSGAGDDKIAIDGTLSTISIDAGAGDDTVTVGQLYESVRDNNTESANVLPNDAFNTIKTTEGYLSEGVNHATSIVGGEGNDTFNVLHNKAAISLSGGVGNDTFNVAMYQEIKADKSKSIVENGPVTLIGGAGLDKMSIAGSDGDDTFVISKGRIFGNGIDVQSVSIENKSVFGGDGDDEFFVLDSEESEVTKLYGNNGNDSFHNGGVGTADVPVITTQTVDTDAIGVEFVDVSSVTTLSTVKAVLNENGIAKSLYRIRLNKEPQENEVVSVTVFAPVVSNENTQRGDEGVWLVNNKGELCKSITFKFGVKADEKNGILKWDSLQVIKMFAFTDSLCEGNDYFSLLHNVTTTGSSKIQNCKNALVYMNEVKNKNATINNQIAKTNEYVVTDQDITENTCKIWLNSLPTVSEIFAWYVVEGHAYAINSNSKITTHYADEIPENSISIDLSGLKNIAAGAKIYVHYSNSNVMFDNQSVVQLSYSAEKMTQNLWFVPLTEIKNANGESCFGYDAEDSSPVYPESDITNAKADSNCRYVYRTAGTQIVICDKNSRKPVSVYGNLILNSPVSVSIQDELDSFDSASIEEVMGKLEADTIEHIKGALYEDGAGKDADFGIDGPMKLHYAADSATEKDEKNVATDADKKERAEAEAEAAKFDEDNSKDRVFVNNRNNSKNADVNNLDSLIDSVGGKVNTKLLEKDANGQDLILEKTKDVIDQADAEWYTSDKNSLRYDHKDNGAESANQFNVGNMEYAEINLGTGADKVDVTKTVYREDGFQTFTVLNTGSGATETDKRDTSDNPAYDDTVTVHSYAKETSTVLATVTNFAKVSATDETSKTVEYNATLNFNGRYNLNSIVNSKSRVFVNVKHSDGTVQRRELVREKCEDGKLVLDRDLTPVDSKLTIDEIFISNNYAGDGMLVVNAQGGNDKIDAVGDDDEDGNSKVTRDDLVVIGGTGSDTIDVNASAIAFGDRGQIVYKNEKGEIVTVLGSKDIDNSVTDKTLLTEADYTTPAKSEKETYYYQTDGVVRDASYIHSVSEKVGGEDSITTHGDKNVAIGGNGADIIHLDGENNVAVGDNGEVKFVGNDTVKDADGNAINHAYGDSSKTYLNYVQSTSDEYGAGDTITTGDGKNVVIGGSADDTITTGSGNDVIIGDGGEVYVDKERNPLFVNDQNRNSATGVDTIVAGDGDNVVFGGLNDDDITTGRGNDVVFGDNGYATFRGNSQMAAGMDNLPTVNSTATLSFNFQGSAQSGIAETETAGANEYAASHWNNIYKHENGSYGNDDDELVFFDNGSRASAVTVSYGAVNEQRSGTSDGNRVRLHSYDQSNQVSGANSGDVNLMKSGLEIVSNNDRDTLIAQVDGLSQYFESYSAIVYLDMLSEVSMPTDSVRKVSLFIDKLVNGKYESQYVESFYVNDPAGNTFNGSWNVATGKTLNTATIANCVVFSNITADRFHIEITDGDLSNVTNGKDRAGIAGIQVRGTLHKQDVAASTDIALGGVDDIKTGRGDDIVVGGTGSDIIKTFGDDRFGIDDDDIVFGDNAKMVFADRDGNSKTASTVTHAESIAAQNTAAQYNDQIQTGDGDDTVVGGAGDDRIDAGATINADNTMNGVEVLSLNFTKDSTDASMLLNGESAGAVVDKNWHNVYLYNNDAREHATGSYAEPNLSNLDFTYEINGNICAAREEVDRSMDVDTGNNKLMKTYIAGQANQVLGINLNNLSGFTGGEACDVYVYIGGIENDSSAYDYIFRIDGSNGEHYYLNDWSGNKFDGDFKQVACTEYRQGSLVDGVTPSVEMIGNYVVFHNVNSDNFRFTIQRVDTSEGTANPNDIPVFTAVQIVKGVNRTKNIALGGDHDKDLVFGDDAALDFDLDIPFATDEKIGDYDNRVVSAKSMDVGSGYTANDTICTGKDRDVIVGGEGHDTIYAGAGDDVAIGEKVNSLYVEHNNPLGVFSQDVEIVLEDNQYNTATRRQYLDADGGIDANSMANKIKNGEIEGVTLETTGTANNTIFGGSGKNVVLNDGVDYRDGNVDSYLFEAEKDPANDDPDEIVLPTAQNNSEQSGNENSQSGTDSGSIDEGSTGSTDSTDYQENDGTVRTISGGSSIPMTLAAGETVRFVFTQYQVGDGTWTPVYRFVTIGDSGKQFANLEVTVNGQVRTVGADYYSAFTLTGTENGVDENGNPCFIIYVKAESDCDVTLCVCQ